MRARNGTERLKEHMLDIPKKIVPGNEPTMRCCVYKERAILGERIKIAMGGDKDNPNVIEVIEIACDECPMGGYDVTEACRGCLAHRCEDVCRRGAITFDSQQKAHIDKTKCVECGAVRKGLPLQRNNQLQASLHERLQGERDFYDRNQGCLHR